MLHRCFSWGSNTPVPFPLSFRSHRAARGRGSAPREPQLWDSAADLGLSKGHRVGDAEGWGPIPIVPPLRCSHRICCPMQLAVCLLPRLQINFMLDYVTERLLFFFQESAWSWKIISVVVLRSPLLPLLLSKSAPSAPRSVPPQLLPMAEGQLLMFLSIYSN